MLQSSTGVGRKASIVHPAGLMSDKVRPSSPKAWRRGHLCCLSRRLSSRDLSLLSSLCLDSLRSLCLLALLCSRSLSALSEGRLLLLGLSLSRASLSLSLVLLCSLLPCSALPWLALVPSAASGFLSLPGEWLLQGTSFWRLPQGLAERQLGQVCSVDS